MDFANWVSTVTTISVPSQDPIRINFTVGLDATINTPTKVNWSDYAGGKITFQFAYYGKVASHATLYYGNKSHVCTSGLNEITVPSDITGDSISWHVTTDQGAGSTTYIIITDLTIHVPENITG